MSQSNVSQKAVSIANAARERARFVQQAKASGESLQTLVDSCTRKQLLDAASELVREYNDAAELFSNDNSLLPHKRDAKSGEVKTDKNGNAQPVTVSQYPPFMSLARTVRKSSKWGASESEPQVLRIRKGVVEIEAKTASRGSNGSEDDSDGESQVESNSDANSRRKGSGDSMSGVISSTVARIRKLTESCDDVTAKRRGADMLVQMADELGVSHESIRNAWNRQTVAHENAADTAEETADDQQQQEEIAEAETGPA